MSDVTTNPRKLATLRQILKDLGYRLCLPGESGWYVTVQVEGRLERVWATDAAPGCAPSEEPLA